MPTVHQEEFPTFFDENKVVKFEPKDQHPGMQCLGTRGKLFREMITAL